MERYYSFAGVEIALDIPEDRFYTDERDLAPFAVDSVKDPHRYEFTFVEELMPPEGDCVAAPGGFRVYLSGENQVRYIGSVQEDWTNAYMRVEHRDKIHRAELKRSQFPGRVGTHTVLDALAAEHLIAREYGVVFHSSYIAHNGRAILFTAPSGTGKSTQADLWHNLRGSEIINGDRSAIRVVNDVVYAAGVPFSGSSQICVNRTLPLAAIVYLGQAPETSISRVRGYQAFARIWEGCSVNTWDEEDLRRASEVVKHTASTVPVFYLPCTPDESAVIALERALRECL